MRGTTRPGPPADTQRHQGIVDGALRDTALQTEVDALAEALDNDESYRPAQFMRLLRNLNEPADTPICDRINTASGTDGLDCRYHYRAELSQ